MVLFAELADSLGSCYLLEACRELHAGLSYGTGLVGNCCVSWWARAILPTVINQAS